MVQVQAVVRASSLLLLFCTLAILSSSGTFAAPPGRYEKVESFAQDAPRLAMPVGRPASTRYYEPVVSKEDPNELRNLLDSRREIDVRLQTEEERFAEMSRYEAVKAAQAAQYGRRLGLSETLNTLRGSVRKMKDVLTKPDNNQLEGLLKFRP